MRNKVITLAVMLAASCSQIAIAQDANPFKLSSPQFVEGATLSKQQVFLGFGCEGDNQSPALSWSDAPTGTKSFAVTIYDPAAPTGSGWWHWVMFNIPADAKAINADIKSDGKGLPAGTVQVRNDYGTIGFGGACPPPGDKPHPYTATVYALNVESLPLNADATPALVGYMVNSHMISKATITAFYGR